MKILMVTQAMETGGAETHVLELCRELSSRGHSITLVSAGGIYADDLVKSGIRHVTLPLGSKNPASVIKSYKGLKDLIGEGYDIVHAHARIPAFICGLLHDRVTDAEGRKFRFVTTAHLDFKVSPLLKKLSRWGEKTMAVSGDIADYLVREYGVCRSKIYTTVNGIDTVKFSKETDPAPVIGEDGSKDVRRIVYISRLDADRADPAYRLLNISERIHDAYPQTEIIIAGGGTEFGAISSRAREINGRIGREYVRVTGPVTNVNEYCAAADVFIGVSRSVLEAMSAECPVIIAGNQGALGIFDESKAEAGIATNFCCRGYPCATEETLFRDVSELLSKSSEELSEMGRRNRGFILENYTVSAMADDYEKMYRDTVSSPVLFSTLKGRPDAVISGYYGFGNLGDESLLDIIATSIARRMPGVRVAALAHRPRRATAMTGLKCISRYNYFSVSRNLRRAALLISGGGSLLQDATSRRNLLYYAGIIRMAEHRNTKVCVLANGIGPIEYGYDRKFAKKALDSAEFISLRDTGSLGELEEIGVKGKNSIRVTSDPAFLIDPADEKKLSAVRESAGLSERYFAVSVRPLTKRNKGSKEALTGKDMEIAGAVARVAAEISRETGMTALVIPMQEAQDTEMCRETAHEAERLGCRTVTYAPESAGVLCGLLGGAEFLIGMRLHSIIFASSSATPVIGLSYDPKISSLMKDLGQDYVIDLAREGGADIETELRKHVGEILGDHGRISESLTEKAGTMRESASGDIDAAVALIRDALMKRRGGGN